MNIYFIGIGGIGVSALAKYYAAKGNQVAGSDLVKSEITDALKKLGIKVKIGPHHAKDIPKDTDLIIHSPAVNRNNIKHKARILSYPEALGDLTKQHYTIAVSGTHGKSTTTAMIGLILAKAKLDPTVIVGTKLKEFGPSKDSSSNCRVGNSEYLVIEADEHFASFLNYWPHIIVVTNIEPDHLDYYKTFENLKKTFTKFISHLPKEGILIKDESLKRKNKKLRAKIGNILSVPGEHNIENALSALAVARALKIPDKISFKALSEFKGTWRRFEIFNLKKPVSYTLVSDYGHHPTEIKATIQAARQKWPKKKIWLVYQPHQYQRTHYLFKEFVDALSHIPVDKLILLDIYDVPGREGEGFRKKVSSEKLASNIKSALYVKNAKHYLTKNLQGGEIVIVMGAGDIYNLVVQLVNSGKQN